MVARICPNCGKQYTNYPALSRKDNKTKICPDCGTKEAIEDYRKFIKKNDDVFDMERAGKHEE